MSHVATTTGDTVLVHAGRREDCAECSRPTTIRETLTRGEAFARELRERAAREEWARSG